MYGEFKNHLERQLDDIEQQGLTKSERILLSAQGENVLVESGEVLNLCANNYLGLAQHPEVIAAAKTGLDEWGYGLASVRFICGTQSIHKELEHKLSDFLGMQDTILYPSSFDANGGLFETLLTNSTMRRSSTACAYARRSATAIKITIWPIWNCN